MLLLAAGCTDLGGAPPDGAAASDPPGMDGSMLCDAEAIQAPDDAGGDGVSLRRDLQPLLTRTCVFSGCHGQAGAALGLVLAEGSARSHLVCVPAAGAPNLNRVEKGSPQRSYLVNKLEGTQLDVGGGGHRMPMGQSAWAPADIDLVTRWIRAGARDN